MVLIQRRGRPNLACRTNQDPLANRSSWLSLSPGCVSSPKQSVENLSHGMKSKWGALSLSMKLCLGVIFASWIGGFIAIYRARTTLQELQHAHHLQKLDHEEALRTLADADDSRQAVQKQVNSKRHTNEVMKHEVRMMSEMDEIKSFAERRLEKKKGTAQHDILVEWLGERHKMLNDKIDSLKTYLQTESRKAVIEKYGPGPHRVKFTVEFDDKKKPLRSLILELAPLDDMPHSIHMFLNSVSLNLWDNCLFWHVEDVDHVLMAAPIHYHSGESRYQHFSAMGVDGLGFPEYSPKFQHEMLTVGYNGRGPTFYINTQDNAELHGPGGQGHHDLPDDADPCFGKVVQGMDVVRRMNELVHDGSKDATTTNWTNKAMTRIVEAEIL